MGIVFLLFFYLLAPFLINYLCYKSSLLQKLGSVLIAYVFGLVLGNIGIFQEASTAMVELVAREGSRLTSDMVSNLFQGGTLTEEDVTYFQIFKLQDTLTTLAIAFALPLLLFSMNIRHWFKVAGKTFLSLFLGLISVIIPIFVGYFLFGDYIDLTIRCPVIPLNNEILVRQKHLHSHIFSPSTNFRFGVSCHH